MSDTLTEISQIEKFCDGIELLVQKGNSYLESIIEYCDLHDIETEVAAKLISPNLRVKLQHEAENLSLIKKTIKRKLPI